MNMMAILSFFILSFYSVSSWLDGRGNGPKMFGISEYVLFLSACNFIDVDYTPTLLPYCDAKVDCLRILARRESNEKENKMTIHNHIYKQLTHN